MRRRGLLIRAGERRAARLWSRRSLWWRGCGVGVGRRSHKPAAGLRPVTGRLGYSLFCGPDCSRDVRLLPFTAAYSVSG